MCEMMPALLMAVIMAAFSLVVSASFMSLNPDIFKLIFIKCILNEFESMLTLKLVCKDFAQLINFDILSLTPKEDYGRLIVSFRTSCLNINLESLALQERVVVFLFNYAPQEDDEDVELLRSLIDVLFLHRRDSNGKSESYLLSEILRGNKYFKEMPIFWL